MKPGKIKKEIRERYLVEKKKRELEGDKQRQFFREEKKIIGAETKKKRGHCSLTLSLSLSLSLSLPLPSHSHSLKWSLKGGPYQDHLGPHGAQF